MDQVKIGKFISACRKEQNLTQAALAEKLGITDRAISKWENGKSLPDSSIMLELCDLLSININELLKGEKIDMEKSNKESEEIILSLKEMVENKDRELLTLEWVIGIAFVIIISTVGFLADSLVATNKPLATGLLVAAFVIAIAMAAVCIWIEVEAGYYECADCGHRYKPDFVKAFIAPHIGRARRLKCPCCAKKNFHKKVLSRKWS